MIKIKNIILTVIGMGMVITVISVLLLLLNADLPLKETIYFFLFFSVIVGSIYAIYKVLKML